jgi:acyl-CoA thioesterase
MGMAWLGLRRDADARWVLPVASAVLAGSGSLYGGCATAAVLEVAGVAGSLPPRWASVHFVSAAAAGSEVVLTPTLLTQGRTVSHLDVEGVDGTDGRLLFRGSVAVGERRPLGEWKQAALAVPTIEACPLFEHRSHEGTFAERLEWHLVPSDAVSMPGTAAWWVLGDGFETAATAAAVLGDYATYAIGRASGHDIGGMSVDNTVRLHSNAPVSGPLLLVVHVDALDHGFGAATARIWREDGGLVATSSQTMVLNPWNWRQPGE